MPDIFVLAILFGLGAVILIAEIFIPSHGVLTFVGIGFLCAGVWQTFHMVGRQAGVVSVFVCLVLVPTFAYLAVKYWRNTPIGKVFAPPNPVITSSDSSVPVEEIQQLIGKTGRAISALRPVGICQFDGHRISCVAQYGMIEQGDEVQGVGMSGMNLSVAARKKET